MDIRRAIPVVTTDDPDAARRFYGDVLGFRASMEEDGMTLWVSPSEPTTQVIVAWPSVSAVDPEVRDVDISIEVADVDGAYAAAVAARLEIVRPLTDEPWGIRRFFVRDGTGRTVNVAMHR